MIAVVLGAFRPGAADPTAPPPFTLVGLGGTNLKRKALGGEGTRNLTLAQIGLAPPAATLLLQWKGRGGEDAVFPKVTSEGWGLGVWVVVARGADVHIHTKMHYNYTGDDGVGPGGAAAATAASAG